MAMGLLLAAHAILWVGVALWMEGALRARGR